MSVDALSLACNIITVIDFGHKFYETFRDVYDKGASDPTTEYKANELAALAERLKTSRNRALPSVSNNDQLLRVADKCVKAAEDLQNEIRKLTPSDSSSRTAKALRSLLSAGKRTWRHNRIEQLNKSLDECRATMQTAVLLHMYESGEADRAMWLDEFSKLDSRLQSFIYAVSKQDLQMSQLLAESRSLHQEARAVIHQEVINLRNAQISDRQLDQLRSSLRFPEMNQRYNELRAAHERSFKWLLGDSKAIHQSDSENINLEEEPYDIRRLRNVTFGDFKQWLTSEADSKLYWVSGKPGAGKSTLMKYLSHDMENTNLVKVPHLVIRHFFWLGTSDARSRLNDMQGMFTTLLHQLLGHEVFGKPLAATLSEQNPRLSQKHAATDWGLEELEAITQKALEIISRQYLVFILVDALDEHLPVSEHGELLDVFQRFEEMTNVRLVLSSRPERIFDTRLADSRQLRLQDLTGPDIYHFSLGSLLKRVDFQEGRSSAFAKELAVEIVRKAEGVFLWARLAVDSLKRGFVDGNFNNEIWDRLHDMPTELSDYFKSIWKRLGDDQKRYQVFAANVFSLLLCKARDFDKGEDPRNSAFDLLMMGLALNPEDAHLLVHGEIHIEEAYLLRLCQETEKRILSHCAGLVEVSEEYEFFDCTKCHCAPTNIDLTIAKKKCQFVHRTAKDFFRETPEGKRLIDSNDMAQDGTDFRFVLGWLARLAAFRNLRYTLHRCRLPIVITMDYLLSFLGSADNASTFSTEQRYSLIALIHKLHFRFSGHPDNPIFNNWRLANHYTRIYPFVILAAYCGHGDYVVRYLEMQASSGRPFPAEAYMMVFKASLESYLEDQKSSLVQLGTDGPRLKSLVKVIHHLQVCQFPSSIYHGRLAPLVRSLSHRSCHSICHLVLNVLFRIIYVDESKWMTWTHTDMVIGAALNLANLLGTSDTSLFRPILCTFLMLEESWPRQRSWNLWMPYITSSTFGSDLPDQISIVFEVSPIWLIMHIARVATDVQGLETFCDGLIDLADLQCQTGREVQRPRPVLLLGSPERLRSPGYRVCDGAKEIPNEMQVALSEYLIEVLEKDSHDRNDALQQRLREIWANTSIECLQGAKAEESFVSHGLWCSKEEEQKMFKTGNILTADDAFQVGDHDSRYLVPPDSCPEEEKKLSYYLTDEEIP